MQKAFGKGDSITAIFSTSYSEMLFENLEFDSVKELRGGRRKFWGQ